MTNEAQQSRKRGEGRAREKKGEKTCKNEHKGTRDMQIVTKENQNKER